MSSFKTFVLIFSISNIFSHICCLIQLPEIEDNNIEITEKIIRNTLNNLFSTFRIKDVVLLPRFKNLTLLHIFFLSSTLKDSDNLKEISRITRVNNTDYNIQHFITKLNEVLNEGDKSNQENDDVCVTHYIKRFITKLRRLKEGLKYDQNYQKLKINEAVVTQLSKTDDIFNNITEDEIGTDTNNTDEIWQPKDAIKSGRRIFEGQRTRVKYFPFIATVMLFGKFQCAGSIIKNDLIITAASCLQLAWNNRFFRENPTFLSVQVGCDYYTNGGETIGILDIHFHPEYAPDSLENNLALLRLVTQLQFSRSINEVKRIEYDKNPAPLSSNIDGIVVLGWGARDVTNTILNPIKNRLSYAELDFYPLEDCQNIYTKKYVSMKNFCAGFISKGGGACSHDAGGPGVHAGILYGVISFGPPVCGTVDAPTVFTKVGFYRKWIGQIMKQPVLRTLKLSTTRKPRKPVVLMEHYHKPLLTLKPIMGSAKGDYLETSTKQGPPTKPTKAQDFHDYVAAIFDSDESSSVEISKLKNITKNAFVNTAIDADEGLDSEVQMEADIANLLDDLDVYNLLGSAEVNRIVKEQDELASQMKNTLNKKIVKDIQNKKSRLVLRDKELDETLIQDSKSAIVEKESSKSSQSQEKEYEKGKEELKEKQNEYKLKNQVAAHNIKKVGHKVEVPDIRDDASSDMFKDDSDSKSEINDMENYSNLVSNLKENESAMKSIEGTLINDKSDSKIDNDENEKNKTLDDKVSIIKRSKDDMGSRADTSKRIDNSASEESQDISGQSSSGSKQEYYSEADKNEDLSDYELDETNENKSKLDSESLADAILDEIIKKNIKKSKPSKKTGNTKHKKKH